MAWRIKVSHKYISLGYSTRVVLSYAGVSSSTWYYYLKSLNQSKNDRRQFNQGRRPPGFALDSKGNKTLDTQVVKYISQYRNKEFLPSEITKTLFDRIEETDPKLNSYITLFKEAAIESSKIVDEDIKNENYKSEVHGVPFSLKDIFLVKNELCTCGSKCLATMFQIIVLQYTKN